MTAEDLDRLAKLKAERDKWAALSDEDPSAFAYSTPRIKAVRAYERAVDAALPGLLAASARLNEIAAAHVALVEAEVRVYGATVKLLGRCANEHAALMGLLDQLVMRPAPTERG